MSFFPDQSRITSSPFSPKRATGNDRSFAPVQQTGRETPDLAPTGRVGVFFLKPKAKNESS